MEIVKWLEKQAYAFRGNDDSCFSSNGGNFFEMVKLMGLINENVAKVILNNAPNIFL